MKRTWAALAIVGWVVPWVMTWVFFQSYGWRFDLIFSQAFSTLGGAFLSLDLLVAGVAFVAFMLSEQRARPVKFFWVPIAGLFLAGLCFAVPCWLYLREAMTHGPAGETASQ